MQYFNLGLRVLPYALNTFEIALNIAGYCPQLVRGSSAIRFAYGLIQVISSMACETICGLGAVMAHALGRTDLFNFHMWVNMNNLEFTYHGLSNMLRAIFESELGPWMILYDVFFERFSYD